MYAFKKKYFLIIQSIKVLNLRNIKNHNKFVVIYRSSKITDNIDDLVKFRNECKNKFIEFYVANNNKLGILLKADGIYLSSSNKDFRVLFLKKNNFKIIGSAHNTKEIAQKIKQGCNYIFLSKLFVVSYEKNAPFLGVIKFNGYVNKILEPFMDSILDSTDDTDIFKMITSFYNISKIHFDGDIPNKYVIILNQLKDKTTSSKIRFKIMDILDE